jgi:hypothetical protein
MIFYSIYYGIKIYILEDFIKIEYLMKSYLDSCLSYGMGSLIKRIAVVIYLSQSFNYL